MSTQTTGPVAGSGAGRMNPLYFAAWRWHFYAGLYVIPFLIMLSVTGIVMVWFSAIAPEYGERLSLSPAGHAMSVTAQAEAAATHAGGTVTRYIAPYSPENPALFRVEGENGAQMVALDPYSGAVLRSTVEGATWEELADGLHGQLLMQGEAKFWGDLLIEIAASLCLLLVVTGLYLAWPRNGKGMASMLVPDFSATGRAFWKSLHLSLGSWLSLILVFFLISGLSWAGIWGGKFVQAWSTFPAAKWDNVPLSDATHAAMNHTAVEEVPWALEQTPMPASGSDAGVTGTAAGVPVDLESLVALARNLGFDARFQLNYPKGETGVWTISRDSMSNDSSDPTSDRTVHVDRFTGKVLADVKFADYSPAGQAMAVSIPLHMGLMGLWNAVLNIAICLLLIVVSVASVVMWLKRRPSGAARLAAPPRPELVPLSRGMVLIALVMSMAFPVLGLTLLAVLAMDLLVLAWVPPLKRALS
ncbi:MAG TPA: PepSY domain-containing protein [Gemmobacter sp.]|nr:PepSY domain-containing protein [Gemmobacter sp.]